MLSTLLRVGHINYGSESWITMGNSSLQKRSLPAYIWILVLIVVLTGACIYPPFFKWFTTLDESVARWANSVVGEKNGMINMLISLVNTNFADVVIGSTILALAIWHILKPDDNRERLSRLAYWGFTALMFGILYEMTEPIEKAVGRDSPGRELKGWLDLRRMSDIGVKVSKGNSFPSGHASAHFFFAFMLLRRYRFVGWFLVVVAVILPTTRVITGAHWPTDILASVLLTGFASSFIMDTRLAGIYPWMERRVSEVFYLLTGLKRRGFIPRLRSAWAEFVAPASASKEAGAEPVATERPGVPDEDADRRL